MSNSDPFSAIQSYKISIKSEEEAQTCTITCKSAASFYVKCHTDGSLRESQNAHVTHVQYMPTESGQYELTCEK